MSTQRDEPVFVEYRNAITRTVMIESPFEGGSDREADNVAYAKRCMDDALRRGEAPYFPHLLYPHALDDTDPEQRRRGIQAGHLIAAKLDAWVFYLDRGVTPGMLHGIDSAIEAGFRPRYYVPWITECQPSEKPILFRTFDLEGSGMWRGADGWQREASEILLHKCAKWPLLIAQFEKHARREWNLP